MTVSSTENAPSTAAPAMESLLAGSPARERWTKVGGWALAGAVLVVFPIVFTSPAVTTIAVFTMIFMGAATAWNSFCGYSGYVSLGHAVFFGAGAYTIALISVDNNLGGGGGMFWLVPVAGLVAMGVAVPFGLVSLRTRRHTFVVVTIAIFFIAQLLAYNLPFTKGSRGVAMPSPPWTAVGYNIRFYYAALGVAVVAVLLSTAMRRSRFGLQLLAIRDDEDRASGLGVKTTRVKLTAFVLSAFCVGMAGAVWAFFLGQVYPQFAFTPLFDLSVAIMSFLGGLGTISGPLLGAAVLETLQQYFAIQYSSSDLYLIAFGALFLAVILVMPRGVIPTVGGALRQRRERLMDTRATAPDLATPAPVRAPVAAALSRMVRATSRER